MEKEKVLSHLKSAVSNVFTNTCQFGAQNGRCLSFHNKIKTSAPLLRIEQVFVLDRFRGTSINQFIEYLKLSCSTGE